MKFPAIFLVAAVGYAASPVLFYSDLDSGPNAGGENNNGAYVCVWGQNFGASQSGSTITVGGGLVANYPVWTTNTGNPAAPNKACFQLGPQAATGNIVMTVGGQQSNPLPFTVRSGKIYFVSTGGSDSNNGSFTSPWKTIKKCKNSLAPGDTCYVGDGVIETTADTYGYVYLSSSGAQGNPKAIAAYPGATVTVGADNAAISRPSLFSWAGATANYWTIAGLRVIGWRSALGLGGAAHNRIVGNSFQCPSGDSATGCVYTAQSSDLRFLGNEFTNAGCGAGPTRAVDDGIGNSGQTVQSPCVVNAGPGTFSTSDGKTLTGSGYAILGGMRIGDHLIIDLGSGPEEKAITDLHASSSGPAADWLVVNTPFSKLAFSGAAWKWRPSSSSKLYHTFYGTTDTTNIELAWNHVHNNSATHGLNFHSSPVNYRPLTNVSNATPVRVTFSSAYTAGRGQRMDIQNVTCNASVNGVRYVSPIDANNVELYADPQLTTPIQGNGSSCAAGTGYFDGFQQYSLNLHDNVIHHQNGAGISMATNDPSRGAITIYNNVIYATGCGPAIFELYPYVGLFFPGYANTGNPGSGSIQVYNNTIYDIGNFPSFYGGDYHSSVFQYDTRVGLDLKNNIFVQTGGRPYFSIRSGAAVTGSNNLFFNGTGTVPATLTATLTGDPLFLNAPAGDFRVSTGSPAIDAGAPTAAVVDLAGAVRPQGRAYDIGAYEATGAVSTPQNACDLDGSGKVDDVDWKAAIAQSIGAAPCTTLAPLGKGSCDVVAVQRVANAVMTGVCTVP